MAYTMMFYNLENLYDTIEDPSVNDNEFTPVGEKRWSLERYNQKLDNLSEVFAAVSNAYGGFPVIVGVSEVENINVMRALAARKRLSGSHYKCLHYDSQDARGIDVGVLYRSDKFKLVGSEPVKLVLRSGREYIGRNLLAMWGEIDGEMFAFFVTHLPSRVGGKGADLRSGGARIIYQQARALMRIYKGIKIVVMGDMNDDPTDESMSKWLHGKEYIDDMEALDFFNPYTSMLKAGFGSLCYQGVWSIYDQELVNYNLANAPEGTLRIQPIGKNGYYGYIFKRPFMTTQKGQYKGYPFRTFSGGAFIGGYSDHYPTFIVVGK